MGITMEVKHSNRVTMKIQRMGMRARNPEGAWPHVGSYLSAVERRQWATQGAYLLGHPWKPLKPEYLQWKIKHGYSPRILMQTGALRLSFTGRPMSIEVYGKGSARFGSSHRLAHWHQEGTHRNGKRVNPPRPMMKLTPKVRNNVRDILADYVLGKRITVMDRI